MGNMGSGVYFPISVLLFSLLIIILFFSKKHVNNFETKLYGKLIIVNFLGLLLEIACTWAATIRNVYPHFSNIILKLYLLYLIGWVSLFVMYVFYISQSKEYLIKIKKIAYGIAAIIFLFSTIMIFSLPVDLYISPDFSIRYSTGPSVQFTYGLSAIMILIILICMILNIEKIKTKKFFPLLAFLILGGGTMALQYYHPNLLLITYFETFITTLMYHTIENPDMKMIAELNAAKDAADKANQAKSDFLSSMSHEIRTPLNAIVGFSESLKEENLTKEATDEVNDIISASNTLLELVNGILDISKIEANKIELVNNQYSFRKVFNDLVALSKARLGDKPLEFRYKYDESIPEVLYGDSTRVKQVILNLLTNSIKYTKEGYFELKVSSIINNNICRLIISVEDSGIGIKKENINKLFNKFERLDEKNTTIEGTGLGLAITKKLVDLMHGKIVVQSIYNKGSKFTIALDQRVIDAPAKPIEVTNTEYIKKDFTGKKILVVDDNNLNLKVASRLLAPYNCIVETVSSGTECIDKIASNNKYDLILLDDMMPHLSGVDTLHRLKENENFKIPTIALTANAIDGMREKYLNDGFDDYLAKPIEKRELERILNRFLN